MEGQETRGQMTQRHKKELLALKKVRGKSQKEVKEMEKQLREKHKLELENLEKAATAVAATPAPTAIPDQEATTSSDKGKKVSRKQRRMVSFI